jgi:outer membrane protein OmpA-like peptidoglycan-associated protein
MARFQFENENNWISISDIMTGLMVIFMFLAISYIIKVQESQQAIIDIAKKLNIPVDSLDEKILKIVNTQENTIRVIADYKNGKDSLVNIINSELGKDLKKWDATFDEKNLTIRFNGKSTKFGGKDYDLSDGLKEMLDQFFPKYLAIVTNKKYFDLIQELRIEGHAFDDSKTEYYREFNISQLRSRRVLEYLRANSFYNNLDASLKNALDFKIVTTSMGSNRLIDKKGEYIFLNKGSACAECSRRVEFTLVTKTEKVLESIGNNLSNEN